MPTDVALLAEVALFGIGLALLVYGANRAVEAAGELAIYYGVSTFLVGVTVVAVGTSIPEMTTSIYAARYGAGDIVVGNIVGSETSQITLAIGLVALVSPVAVDRRNVMIYGSAMLLAMVIMMLTLDDGRIIRSEGFLMMLAYVNFVYTLYTNEGGAEVGEEIAEEIEPTADERPTGTVLWVVGGLAMVVVGGHLLVTSGVVIARGIGVSEYLVGVLTGLGTTAPEITVAMLAVRAGDEGISVGALLGSNITDPVFSLGVGALVADVVVTDLGVVSVSMTYMLVASIFVLGMLYVRRGIDRRAAVVCLALYLPTFVVL
ncbi:MAG: sodium:calcium antiporter [Haloferacaceae archaeon]